ncbi:PIG-L family deacetylase [Sediminibacterium sp.]|uniref:PIG-L family deacetylase n=1 Tax=Sediminibacterium sp. TaxID=1917865 RepID=UPI0025D09ABA|nr:PIG-L family deacetylase [Sediminibacterium sp.]MBW0177983.1 PIG-L family deacetylase [Sediminibacterium sp.]
MKKNIALLFLSSCFFIGVIQAQIVPVTASSADIYQQLKKLNVLGSVLYIAAHPDDENNGLLPYLAKEKLYRTAYLSLTRGDGGQNLIGPEQGIELGMIRTHELMAARAIDGSEQYFTRAYEFGFSKSSEEALRVWDRGQVLADVVWMIRTLQPDIIIARFPPDARAGHGHHAASAIIAEEAYKVAADSTKFTEHFKYGVKPWKAKRLLWNTFNFGRTNTTSENQLKMEVGAYNPLLGKSYGELGGEARSMHKSQAEGRPRRRGEVFEYFVHVAGDSAKTDVMEGVNTSWSRLKKGREVAVVNSQGKEITLQLSTEADINQIQNTIQEIIDQYDFKQPHKSVPRLTQLYKHMLNKMPDGPWRSQKLKEIQAIIEFASGLFVEAFTQQETALKGDSVRVNFFVNKRTDVNAKIRSMRFIGEEDTVVMQPTEKNRNYQYARILVANKGPEFTQPYWLSKTKVRDGMFVVEDQQDIGKAWSDPIFAVNFDIEIEGVLFQVQRPVLYKYVDAERGELYQPFVIVPHIEVYMGSTVVLLNVKDETGRNRADSMLHVVYRSNFSQQNVTTTLNIRQESIKPVFSREQRNFVKGQRQVVNVPIARVYNPNASAQYMEATISIVPPGGRVLNFSDYFKSIHYDHIPNINYAFRDHVKILKEEIKVRGKKVGYIPGSGDMMPEALKQLGYEVRALNDADINDENLQQFDAIVTGVRAYNLNEWLTGKYDVMMRYVERGGNLIVQYNRNQGGVPSPKMGPYPFQISSNRVTEEDAEVRFAIPDHPVLNFPNKIGSNDFVDWVQERSTYQADQADSRYQSPLSMNDTGEKASSGSLITTAYGKGNFAYVSLVMFRQLPAGNAGAFKILANLIAMPKH